MSDKFYSYSDNCSDQIDVSYTGNCTNISASPDSVNIPPEELPKLIAVLQSHLEEPTDDRPWFMIKTNSDLVGPFASEDEARDRCKKQGDMVRQVSPPEPDIDHEWAGNWAKELISCSIPGEQNLARAYLELSAKQ